ncbi:chromate transporter [Albimonas donghaensis]|uniref:Chromate transporter n=1 Tax=Albimonas donghaensis TaxID=356660 RepID=A0A1H3A9W8_9RHOB|nr:chromate transporter [Albimonas donghaensis]
MASGGIAETGSDGGAPKGAAGTPPAASPAGDGPGAAPRSDPHPGLHPGPRPVPRPPGGAAEVFVLFLRLGLTSFGGPAAHLGFFREAVVARRGWLDEAAYAELVALCQFMPGPASSQLGFALGLLRAGWAGALAAFAGFTLPSALLMAGFAAGVAGAGAGGFGGAGWLMGLKAAAVAVVAQALMGMGRSLAPDARRKALAGGAAALALLAPGVAGQLGAIGLGALAGLFLLPEPAAEAPGSGLSSPISRRAGAACLAAFAGLLALSPLLAGLGPLAALADGFYRSGALVFGGGHVVLPLLEAETVARGLVPADAFVAGYGAAQAVPGPLFTFAAFLGWMAEGAAGACVALAAIFLPGFLAVAGALPFWAAIRARPGARAALMGVNAAVVGLLLAALYDPVFAQGAATAGGAVTALAAWLALVEAKLSPVIVVAGAAALGQGLAWAGLG